MPYLRCGGGAGGECCVALVLLVWVEERWIKDKTHKPGLPLPGSPLVFIPPKILRRAKSSSPHPSGSGGKDAAWPGLLSEVWRSYLGPHPSREGRGHCLGCRVWLSRNGKGGGGGSGMGWRTNETQP